MAARFADIVSFSLLVGWLLNSYVLNALSPPPPSFAKLANEPGLHELGQDRIGQQHSGQIQPVERRERDKAEGVGQRRDRQPGAGRDDDYGGEDERPTGPALDERDFVGANDMDDQCLGAERLIMKLLSLRCDQPTTGQSRR